MNKYGKYSGLKFAEFESVGGGNGEGSGEGAGEAASENSGNEGQQVVKTPAAFDPKEFAREFGSTFANQFQETQKKQEQSQKQMSPEEAKKALNVWEPDDAFFQRYGNLDTQKVAMLEMRDGLIKQMDTIMQARQFQADMQWKQQFEPVAQMLTQRQQAEQISKFEAAYPSLAKSGLSDMRSAIGQRLQQTGAFQNKSEAEAFDILANAMASSIKEVHPDFSLGNAQTVSRTVRSGNGITPSSTGSGGGGSGTGGNEGNQGFKTPKAVSFLPKIKG